MPSKTGLSRYASSHNPRVSPLPGFNPLPLSLRSSAALGNVNNNLSHIRSVNGKTFTA